jgi:hypothetical protein
VRMATTTAPRGVELFPRTLKNYGHYGHYGQKIKKVFVISNLQLSIVWVVSGKTMDTVDTGHRAPCRSTPHVRPADHRKMIL